MKTATATLETPLPMTRSRWLDFVELTKPRIGLMVLFTVAIGGLLAKPGAVEWIELMHAVIGAALVASGASALNQWLECRSDALMRRTENRPLPARRLSSGEVLGFGIVLSVVGLAYMLVVMAHLLAAVVTAVTLVSYVAVYTPLKRKTSLNTLVGAVPGALPPVIGWTALTGTLDVGALILFLIVFLWQVPHFLAIAWIYRKDYARAGLKMLPGVDDDGSATARQMVIYTLALITCSLLPVLLRDASIMYAFGALGMGVYFLRSIWGFLGERSDAQARRVLHASLIYLPAVMMLLLFERWFRILMVSN